MNLRRVSITVGVVSLVGALAMTSSPAEASKAPAFAAALPPSAASPPPPAEPIESSIYDDEGPVRDSVAQQNTTNCGTIKHACGINGIYVCCDKETECCKRKHRRTVCEHKKDNKPC